MIRSKIPRRKFLQVGTAAAAGTAVSCGGSRSQWRFFTSEEAALAAAICDRIIPPDQDSGASQAGVVTFLDRQLAGPYKRFQQAYREGLPGVDSRSIALFQKKFVELPAREQDEALGALDKEKAPFLALIVAHTMQGFYGDPRHGGNRDAASWKMLGVPLVPVRGRAQYDLTRPGTAGTRPRRRTWQNT